MPSGSAGVPEGARGVWRKSWCPRGIGCSGCPGGNPGALRGSGALGGQGALEEILVPWGDGTLWRVWVPCGALVPCGVGVRPPKQMQKQQNHLILNKSLGSSQRRWMLCVSDSDFKKFRVRFT